MASRVMGSILKLFAQIDEIGPNRSTASDGTFPSREHHLRNPNSDHEPHSVPGVGSSICTAGDYTHDPRHGADMARVAESLRRSHDPRLKYVIWGNRMFSSYQAHDIPAWTWRKYRGEYHDHLHVSVLDAPIATTTTPWSISMDLDGDIDFTALKYRIRGLLQMQDPIHLGVNGADGKPRTEPNILAQEINKINSILADLSIRIQEAHAALKGLPDFEPGQIDRETVKLGVQDAFAESFPPRP